MPQPRWTLAQGAARVCYGNTSCSGLDEAIANVGHQDWRARLPAAIARLPGDGDENCGLCNGSMPSDRGVMQDRGLDVLFSYSRGYPHETWDLSSTIGSLVELPQAKLSFVQNDEVVARCKRREVVSRCGFVPTLIPRLAIDVTRGWRSFRRGGSPPLFLPCSSARGEDAAVLRTFFSHAETGQPLRGGTFLEIGAVEGLTESNTWVLENCFGWRGVLVEGHPLHFERLVQHRPRSLNIHLAACASRGFVKYVPWLWTGAKTKSKIFAANGYLMTECAPIGSTLVGLGVTSLDFVSVDVEGAELTVVSSLVAAATTTSPVGSRLALGVVLVEVRADGQRGAVMAALLGAGLRYVGELHARGSEANGVIDDVFVNATHLRAHFGESRAARSLAKALGHDEARAAAVK